MKTLSGTIRKWTVGVVALAAAGFLFTSCRKSDNNYIEVPSAGLMAFNLAPSKNAIGIALSGNSISNQPLTYTSFTGQYLNIYTGNRNIEAFDYNGTTAFTNTSFNFEKDKYYSVFVVGSDSAYRNIVATDNFDSLSASNGKAYVRFINAIPDSSKPTVKITSNGNSVVNAPASYTEVSQFAAIDPGSVAVDVSNGGNIAVNRNIDLAAKKAYTVLLIGKPGESGEKALQIRFIENGVLTDSAQ
jgi:hypothetical protein